MQRNNSEYRGVNKTFFINRWGHQSKNHVSFASAMALLASLEAYLTDISATATSVASVV